LRRVSWLRRARDAGRDQAGLARRVPRANLAPGIVAGQQAAGGQPQPAPPPDAVPTRNSGRVFKTHWIFARMGSVDTIY
jgi:hypothetical protein